MTQGQLQTARFKKMWLAGWMVAAVAIGSLIPGGETPRQAHALPSSNVVISQVYGGGGNAGATYTHDFVEIFNRGSVATDLAGWSVQYASATGIGNFSATPLPPYILQPGQYLLIQQAAGAGGTTALPTPDATGSIAMSATAGKVAVVNSATALACNGGSAPCSDAQLAQIVDLVGYGNANFFEGAAAPGLSNTTAATRLAGGCADTDNNLADFAAAAPAPRNTASPLAVCAGEAAPAVTGTIPSDGTANIAVDSNITVNFSEPVDIDAGAVTVECPVGTPVASSGAGTNLTQAVVNPIADLPSGTPCRGVVHAIAVHDVDANDPPDNLAADVVFSFTTAVADVCGAPFTPIYTIQGSGPAAAITGLVSTEGVVAGDFQPDATAHYPGLEGFYIQDAAGDGDPATSDGIFVYTGATQGSVAPGDHVRVTGFARERFNQTSLNGANTNTSPVTQVQVCGSGSLTPVDLFLPQPLSGTVPNLEQFEGMLVRLPQTLVISEYFNYDRFGEVVLSLPLAGEARPFTGTAIDEPGAAANGRTAANQAARITLDDARNDQNPEYLRHPNGGQFTLANRFRGGDTVTDTVGILGFDFSLYRIQPTAPAQYNAVNPRPAAPSPVGGSLRVAAMNTLNFFVSPDPEGPASGDVCGGNANLECRGWDASQPLEFTRQRNKLVQALLGLDADVLGLNEIENTPGVEPLADIVAGLNAIAGAGTYGYIDTGVIGTDAIRVGFIYKPGKVSPQGTFKVLDSSVDPRFIDTKSRPVLAQTFRQGTNGSVVTVAVAHLKSKGSSCNDVGDPDAGDGQGNCAGTRKLAAEALVDWLATDPTGSGDPDFLIIGDMNSYAKEDSIDSVLAGPDDIAGTADDYVNLVLSHAGAHAYSYVFDAQSGYLDHALASATLAQQVTGLTEWHINADEPDVFDYDTSFKGPNQEALYEPNAFRTSDHDPVLVGMNLSVCANLGDNAGHGPDVDGFTFEGSAGERVTVRLEPADRAQAGRASLAVKGPLFVKVTNSGVPNEVSGTLLLNGTYTILVSELGFGPNRFTGNYCLRVTSSGSAGGTVVPTAVTE